MAKFFKGDAVIDQAQNNTHLPLDVRAIRWLLQLPPDIRRQLLVAITESSAQVQGKLLAQIEVLENPRADDSEKQRAYGTIRNALGLQACQDLLELDIDQCELRSVVKESGAAYMASGSKSQQSVFYEKLEILLNSKRLTQSELAARLGMSQPAISQMLTRKCRPQRATILRIAAALEVDPQELWPDLEVARALDSVASVQEDQQLTIPEAEAIKRVLKGKPAKAPARPLPKLKG
jgi:transcriptional regulator with XRE-family HTH domain